MKHNLFTLFWLLCPLFTFAQSDSLRCFEFGFDNRPDSVNFIACTSVEEVLATVDSQLMMPVEDRFKHINGVIARGKNNNNDRYDWHFVPNQWVMADFSTEVCDGSPSFVSNNLDYWVDTVGRYCPWSSHVVQEVEISSVKQISDNSGINIYPNPANETVYIDFTEFPQTVQSIQVYDAVGRLLITQQTRNNALAELRVDTLPKGFYVVNIATDDTVWVGRLVVR